MTVMVHTFIGTDRDEVRDLGPLAVQRVPAQLGRAERADSTGRGGWDGPRLRSGRMSPAVLDSLVARSFDHYFDTGGLFGTAEDGERLAARLAGSGVDEIACLIDFGVERELVLDALNHLDELRLRCADLRPAYAIRNVA